MRVECHPHRDRVVKHIPESVSVRACKPGAHVFYLTHILLQDVSFDVQPSGPERVNRNGVRDVHAFARGEAQCSGVFASLNFFQLVGDNYSVACYNPFLRNHFFDRDTLEKVTHSPFVLITGGVCYYAL